jgi:tetratricopeptide (TPR) repeat protein
MMTPSRVCPACGTELAPQARYCPGCGAILSRLGLENQELARQLSALEAGNLVQRVMTAAEPVYEFRHVLIQDAVRAALVRAQRERLHRVVSETLEDIFADRLGDADVAPLLARHFVEARDDERALKYLILAGDSAARMYANAEAALHYEQALEICRRGSGLPAADLAQLYLRFGLALELDGRHDKALKAYRELGAVSERLGDQTARFTALMAQAKLHSTVTVVHDPDQAERELREALVLAYTLGDRPAQTKVLWNLMILLVYGAGELRQAIAYGEKALAINRELGLQEQLAHTLNDLTYAYFATGQFTRATAAVGEAQALWRALNIPPMLVDSLCNQTLLHIRAGEYQAAIALADEAWAISQSIENVWGQANSRFYIGLAHLERGDPDRAMAAMAEAIRLGQQVGHAAAVLGAAIDLAWVYGVLGAPEQGLAQVQGLIAQSQEMALARTWPYPTLVRLSVRAGKLDEAAAALAQGKALLRPEGLQMFVPITLPLAEAELEMARGQPGQALAVIRQLSDLVEKSGAKAFGPEVSCLEGRALTALGQLDEAYSALWKARARAEAIGAQRIQVSILTSLAEVMLQLNRPESAATLVREAESALLSVAAHIASPQLRASYLSATDAQSIRTNK